MKDRKNSLLAKILKEFPVHHDLVSVLFCVCTLPSKTNFTYMILHVLLTEIRKNNILI